MTSTSMAAATSMAVGMRSSSPFTVSQWQELEHQALIFKYLIAGMPIPPDLVLPIQKSFEAIPARFFHHPTMAYCSLYGKKVDPEPGRCRRTDGKKWRCSKDAYPDSKYCERHMHRGRNRSRKPVESQAAAASHLSSPSTVTSLTNAGSNNSSISTISTTTGGAASFQNLPFPFANTQGSGAGIDQSRLHLEHVPYGIPHNEYRYVHGLKLDGGEHSFFSEASGSNNRGPEMDSPVDNAWPLMPSQVSFFPTTKASVNSILQNDYPQHSFFSNEYGTASEQVKQGEGQSLRPFFDEWPNTRDTAWSGLEDESSNRTSFSTTQLSISIPMASSDLSTRSSHSPRGF